MDQEMESIPTSMTWGLTPGRPTRSQREVGFQRLGRVGQRREQHDTAQGAPVLYGQPAAQGAWLQL